ncbi:MAG: Aerobic glycerol-3-phosphate dehydrogenase [Candidatus Heimdallarchaeota archaeon LC_3]|nr:MAG: Aerobic glycerol-3-phosphate dehydrogenase [Candidatus Heimdallarchaeota archaeon LC_3]
MLIEEASKLRYDAIIIGGGITGAGIALDATLRGLKVILFEKKDFASGTSSKSSKLIHGGLRYLEHYKFGLVKESLRERAVLREIAPHQVHTLPFVIPIYKNQKPPAFIMRLGLWTYDILSIGKNLGWHKWRNKKKTLELIPNISPEKLQGAGYYFDAQMNDARINLEVILTAKKNGAEIFNYTNVVDFRHDNEENNKIIGVKIQNENLKEFDIFGKIIINASGAWGDEISWLEDPNAERKLGVSKGIHIIVKRFIDKDHAIVVTMKDGRIIFVIPFGKKYSIIGTTDTFYEESIEEIIATKEDIEYLLEGINKLFPKIGLKINDIISSYAGVRPLVYTPKDGVASASDVSREHKIVTSSTGLITIVGGKYTTYRKMGKRITDLILKELKKQKKLPDNIKKCSTSKTQLINGQIDNWEEFYKDGTEKVIKQLSCLSETSDMLLRMYGSNIDQFLDFCTKNPKSNKLISEYLPYIENQVLYAVKYELVRHIDDFLMRRTFSILEFNQGADCVEKVAELIGNKLGWDTDKKTVEINEYKRYLSNLNQFKYQKTK